MKRDNLYFSGFSHYDDECQAAFKLRCRICRAAFKNFSDAVTALREMRRTLKPDAIALIIDMRNDVSDATIDEFVKSRAGSRVNALITGWTFKHMLRKRAYSRSDMLAMATTAGFTHCDITEASIGMEVWLRP
jgi:ubiquinone/menaquinone biosynthesis C-methylase UbiE